MNDYVMEQIKERLDLLDKTIREDDCDLLPIFQSARDNFMKFMNDFHITEKPLIGVTNDGRITGEWRDKKDNRKVIAIVICDSIKCVKHEIF